MRRRRAMALPCAGQIPAVQPRYACPSCSGTTASSCWTSRPACRCMPVRVAAPAWRILSVLSRRKDGPGWCTAWTPIPPAACLSRCAASALVAAQAEFAAGRAQEDLLGGGARRAVDRGRHDRRTAAPATAAGRLAHGQRCGGRPAVTDWRLCGQAGDTPGWNSSAHRPDPPGARALCIARLPGARRPDLRGGARSAAIARTCHRSAARSAPRRRRAVRRTCARRWHAAAFRSSDRRRLIHVAARARCHHRRRRDASTCAAPIGRRCRCSSRRR